MTYLTRRTLEVIANDNVEAAVYIYAESNSKDATNSIEYISKVILNYADLPLGKYRLGWNYNWSMTSTNHDFKAQIINGASIFHEHIQELKDSGNNPPAQVPNNSGFTVVNLTGTGTIELQYCSGRNTKSASIWNARLELERVEYNVGS